MNQFSQNDEQRVILDYFAQANIIGTFIDIGCNDGQTFSNTRALALSGWKGVLVDPSPNAIAKCRELYKGYKGFYVYEFAISNYNGKKILQESGPLCSASDIGLVSTFHSEEKARFDKTVQYTPVEVKTFKWKTFLNRLRIKEFDMVSMDCEGDELNILPDMDLSKVKLIVIEFNGKQKIQEAYEKYLDGFKLIYTTPENLIYAR